MRILFAMLLLTSPALAETKVMLLTDADQQKFIRVIDAASKGQGVNIVMDASDMLRLLLAAGTLQEPPISPEPPKEEPK